MVVRSGFAVMAALVFVGCDDASPGVAGDTTSAGDAAGEADTAGGETGVDAVLETSQEEVAAPEVEAETVEDDVLAETEADTSVPADTAIEPEVVQGEGPRLSFTIEPFTVQSGQERQVCKSVNIPAGAALDVVRFESNMRGISHHFNLYKVIDGTALNPASAGEAVVHDCEPAAEQLRGDAAYIFGSATPERVMQTPPGVAFHLLPGQRLILEYHAINYTTEPIEASLTIDLVGAPPEMAIEHHAEIIWFANWGFALPPGQETSDTASCSVPYDVEIFGLMSHFHELGEHFTIEAVRDGEAELVYEDDDWAHPKYEGFSPPLSLAEGDRLRWTCTWNNDREPLKMVFPNKGSQDEMCMVFAAAYPKATLSAEPIQCNVWF